MQFTNRINRIHLSPTAAVISAAEQLKSKGVEFSQKPEIRPWGIEAVFSDLYGNKYALVQESAQVLTDEAESAGLGIPSRVRARGIAGAAAALDG